MISWAVHNQLFQCLFHHSSRDLLCSVLNVVGVSKHFPNMQHPHLLIDVNSTNTNLHLMHVANTLHIHYCGTWTYVALSTYVHKYFTYKYLNIMVPSNCNFEDAKPTVCECHKTVSTYGTN